MIAFLLTGVAMSADQAPRDQNPSDERQAEADSRTQQTLPLNQQVPAETRQQGTQPPTACQPQADWDLIEWLLLGAAAIGIFLTVKLERPWLIVALSDENIDEVGQLLRKPMPESEVMRPLSVHPALTNPGRVPGWIIEQSYDLRRFPFELPTDPPYGDSHCKIQKPPPIPVRNGEDVRVQLLNRVLFLSPETVEGVRAGKYSVAFFGYFKYRGIFRRWGKLRETRFCWTTRRIAHEQPRGGEPSIVIFFEPGGPPNWTRYT